MTVLSNLSANKHAVHVCSIAGINLMTQQKMKLSGLAATLEISVYTIQNERDRNVFWRDALMILRVAGAVADATMSIAENFGPPPIKAIGKFYSGAKDVALTAGNAMAGNGYDAAKGAIGLASKKGGSQVESAVKLKTINVDIVRNWVADDKLATSHSILEMGAEIAKQSYEYLDQKSRAEFVGCAMTLINSAAELYKIYEDRKENNADDAAFEKQKAALGRQAAALRSRIRELDGMIDLCSKKLNIAVPTAKPWHDLKMPPTGPQFRAAPRG